MSIADVAAVIDLATRGIAVVAVGLAGLVGATHWGVRSGRIKPFGSFPVAVRRWTDPLLRPVEQRLVSAGRNPQDAVWWLFVGTLVAGLLLVVLERWIMGFLLGLLALSGSGPVVWLQSLILGVTNLVLVAILIRVVGSWVGLNPYATWMRPVRWLSDWIIVPIRRRLPAFGMFDLSPLLAYVAVLILRWLLLGILQPR